MKRDKRLKMSALALAGISLLAVSSSQAQQAAYDPAIEYKTTIADGFTYAVVGDVIMPHPLAEFPDPAFQAALKIIKDADAAYANFEMTALDLENFKYPSNGGFGGEPAVAKDIKAMGFDAVGRASNHQNDFGPEGSYESNDLLEEAGVVITGSGRSYGIAHAPRYLMTSKGRMGLLAAATSQPFVTTGGTRAGNRAKLPAGQDPGHGGVAVLDVQQTFLVPRSMKTALDTIREAIPAGGALYAPEDDTPERFSMLGYKFSYGDVEKPQFTYKMRQSDVDKFVHAVKEAKIKSDFVSFGIHTHETKYPEKPDTDPLPGDFLQPFARTMIDAGADAFVGTGVHVLRGIEIYKGRPIYYGLAEFIRQMDINRFTSQLPARGDVNSDPKKYETVIAVNRFQGGQLAEIRLYPVQLGGDLRMALRGIPRIASPEIARSILNRLQEQSDQYGTKIAIENNIGIIRVAAAQRR
jgi:poly-gamma-glutamate capsule biosynthesis protein CapA/YwtB (metallophosphatase superfamily)